MRTHPVVSYDAKDRIRKAALDTRSEERKAAYYHALTILDGVTAETVYSCFICGSKDLLVSAWVHLNKWALTDHEGPMGEFYCNDCGNFHAKCVETSVHVSENGQLLNSLTHEKVIT